MAKKVGNPFDKPFTPVVPPVMAKSEIMKKMDRFDPIEDRYYLKDDDILLVGSAISVVVCHGQADPVFSGLIVAMGCLFTGVSIPIVEFPVPAHDISGS